MRRRSWALTGVLLAIATGLALVVSATRQESPSLVDPRVLPRSERMARQQADLEHEALRRARLGDEPGARASRQVLALGGDAPRAGVPTVHVVCSPWDDDGPVRVEIAEDVPPMILVLVSSRSPVEWSLAAPAGATVARIVVPADADTIANGSLRVATTPGLPKPELTARFATDGVPGSCGLYTSQDERFFGQLEAQLGSWPASLQIHQAGEAVTVGPETPAWRAEAAAAQLDDAWRTHFADQLAELRRGLDRIRVQAVLPDRGGSLTVATLSATGRTGGLSGYLDPGLRLTIGGTGTGALLGSAHPASIGTTAASSSDRTADLRVVKGRVVTASFGLALELVTNEGRIIPASHIAIDSRRDLLLVLDGESTVSAFDLPRGVLLVPRGRILGAGPQGRSTSFKARAMAYSEHDDGIVLLGDASVRRYAASNGELLTETPLPSVLRRRAQTPPAARDWDQMWSVDEMLVVLRIPLEATLTEGSSAAIDLALEPANRTWLPDPISDLPRVFVLDGQGKTLLSSAPVLSERFSISFWLLALSGTVIGGVVLFATVSIAAVRRGRLARSRARQLADRAIELERLAGALTHANESLAARTKDVELYSQAISHEIRGPLSAAAEALRQLPVASRDEQWTTIARENVRRATDKATRLAHLMATSAVVEPRRSVALAELIPPIIDELRARPGGTAVEFVLGDDLPSIVGQPRKIGVVFQNLLENAFKHTCDRPRPRIEVGSYPAGSDQTCWVRDNGPGIDPALQAAIFEPFHRGEDTTRPGMGLGLALVRQIVDENRGELWVESTPEHGSTFFVTLPTAQESEHDAD